MAKPGRKSNKQKADLVKTLFEKTNNLHRQRWQGLSQEGYDFYLGEQLTASERSDIEEAGMPTFTINRILPIIEIMRYFVTANNPKWKAVGAEGSDVDVAQVHSDIADYCWYLSNGKSLYGQVALDALTKGIGYFLVDVDRDADLGMGEVTFSRIDPYDVYVDPSSRDFLFRDASYVMIRKLLARTQLQKMLPEYERKVKAASGSGSVSQFSEASRGDSQSILPEDITLGISLDAEDDDLLDYYELYEKTKVPYVTAFVRIPLTDEQLEEIQRTVEVQIQEYTAELMVQLEEKKTEVQMALEEGDIIEERAELEVSKAEKMTQQAIQEQSQLLMSQAQDAATQVEQMVIPKKEYDFRMESPEFAKNLVNAVGFFKTHCKLTCVVSDQWLYEYEMPYENYPIVPVSYLYTGTPYPMSAVMPLVGKQKEINKAHQIMIHNANLSSNMRWLYEEGSVDEEEWEQYSSAPGALLKYRQGFQPPTAVLPAPINSAFYTITQEGKSDAEYISGVPSAMMGFTSEQAETYRGLLANDEFGTRRLKAWMNNIVEPSLEHLGRVFKELAQSHYTTDKIFRIVQPLAGEDEEREVRVNIPIYNDYGHAIGKYNDYASARFDIRIIAGATLPLNRWALIEEYFRWFQAGLIDDIAMIAETDIRNKESIIERKSMYAQMQSQIESMTEQIKDGEGTIETLERQLVQAGIKQKVMSAGTEIRKDVLETEAQQKLLRGLLKGEFEQFKAEMDLKLKSVDKNKEK
jgi:hypothetical protein|tara:strand:- start:1156 stop:3405 length:2250 start_codon:yes stop_codon:yes gene_type:complete